MQFPKRAAEGASPEIKFKRPPLNVQRNPVISFVLTLGPRCTLRDAQFENKLGLLNFSFCAARARARQGLYFVKVY